MAFEINKDTSAITMHRGDTGAYYVTLTQKDGGSFIDGDLAIYEVKQGENVLIHREFNLQPPEPNDYECGDGKFLIAFNHATTDSWATGSYSTEIRVVYNPIRNRKAAVIAKHGDSEDQDPEDPIIATIDEDTCAAYIEAHPELFSGDIGSTTATYNATSETWSKDPADFGITLTGTPQDNDILYIFWQLGGTQKVIDGTMVRTITKSKSTITILDTLIDI